MRVVEVHAADDPRVSDYRDVRDADLRASRGLFLAEGRLTVKRLLSSRYRTRSVFVTRAGLEGIRTALDAAPAAPTVFLASQALLNEVVGYDMHRGCLAAAERGPEQDLETALAGASSGPQLWTLLEDVTNPDNVGGIFRNALAFGVDQLLLTPRCTDPLYRKAIRVSMGAALRLPFARAARWPAELARLRDAGLQIVALDAARDALPIAEFVPAKDARGVAVLLGSEGSGLSAAAVAGTDVRVTIPMAKDVDSLNAATASGIALHRIAAAIGRVPDTPPVPGEGARS